VPSRSKKQLLLHMRWHDVWCSCWCVRSWTATWPNKAGAYFDLKHRSTTAATARVHGWRKEELSAWRDSCDSTSLSPTPHLTRATSNVEVFLHLNAQSLAWHWQFLCTPLRRAARIWLIQADKCKSSTQRSASWTLASRHTCGHIKGIILG
jgi:hypothetical protein